MPNSSSSGKLVGSAESWICLAYSSSLSIRAAASAIYLSKDDATDTYLSLTAAGNTYAQRAETICYIDFDSTKGLRYQKVPDFGNVSNQAFTTVATIADLKSALLSISDDDFTAILNAV